MIDIYLNIFTSKSIGELLLITLARIVYKFWMVSLVRCGKITKFVILN